MTRAVVERQVHQVEMRKRYLSNLTVIQKELAAACASVHRDPDEVRVIAVTKYVDESAVSPLLDAGVRDFGENRWQQAQGKVQTPRASDATWHFIGRLQSNKVKDVVKWFDWIHSVDSYELALHVSTHAQKLKKHMNLLLQVNASGEATKAGVTCEDAVTLAQRLQELPNIEVRGLMTMAPLEADQAVLRNVFRETRECLERIREVTGNDDFCELSMGMSNDFVIAVQEGATMVRIGRSLVLTNGDE